MSNKIRPNIVIEKINFERFGDIYEAAIESSKEWFSAGMIPKPDLSRHEFEHILEVHIAFWEQDNAYWFYILDEETDQIVGVTFLNQINRTHQLGNLGYLVRTSRTGEGIATEAARLVARFGFEELGLQRIEIVVHSENSPSLKVAEKLGATREALLRNRLLVHDIPSFAYMHSLIPSDFGINKAV